MGVKVDEHSTFKKAYRFNPRTRDGCEEQNPITQGSQDMFQSTHP